MDRRTYANSSRGQCMAELLIVLFILFTVIALVEHFAFHAGKMIETSQLSKELK